MGTKQKLIRKRVWRALAKRRFFGRVRAGAVGWPLEDIYKTKMKRRAKGVKGRPVLMARIRRKWTPIKGAFLATMPTGHLGVFARKGQRDLPLKTVRSDSVTTIIEREGMTPELMAFGRKKFLGELLDATDYYRIGGRRDVMRAKRAARKGSS